MSLSILIDVLAALVKWTRELGSKRYKFTIVYSADTKLNMLNKYTTFFTV